MSIFTNIFKVKSTPEVRRNPNKEAAKQLVFDARWGVAAAPLGTEVKISAVSKITIESATAEIRVFRLKDGAESPVEVFSVPFKDKKSVDASWTTKAVDSGNFTDGVYHFRVTVGGYYGETVRGLKLQADSFQAAPTKKPLMSLDGR